jgi:hypothetical protein
MARSCDRLTYPSLACGEVFVIREQLHIGSGLISMAKSHLRLVAPTRVKRTSERRPNADVRSREHLPLSEVKLQARGSGLTFHHPGEPDRRERGMSAR